MLGPAPGLCLEASPAPLWGHAGLSPSASPAHWCRMPPSDFPTRCTNRSGPLWAARPQPLALLLESPNPRREERLSRAPHVQARKPPHMGRRTTQDDHESRLEVLVGLGRVQKLGSTGTHKRVAGSLAMLPLMLRPRGQVPLGHIFTLQVILKPTSNSSGQSRHQAQGCLASSVPLPDPNSWIHSSHFLGHCTI